MSDDRFIPVEFGFHQRIESKQNKHSSISPRSEKTSLAIKELWVMIGRNRPVPTLSGRKYFRFDATRAVFLFAV
jgi:hypothetical protein